MALVSIQHSSPIMTAENVNDLLEHTSIEFVCEYMQDKIIYVSAVEVVLAAGVPGPLNCWVEVSPVPSVNTTYYQLPLIASAAFWGAIGGGGGALPPVAPVVEAALGVNLTIHNFLIPWAMHTNYARLIVQTPVAATPATDFWVVTAIYAAKTVG